jgi:hypothetical protein
MSTTNKEALKSQNSLIAPPNTDTGTVQSAFHLHEEVKMRSLISFCGGDEIPTENHNSPVLEHN